MTKEFASERKAGETEEQFFYKNRKRVYGPFKKALLELPAPVTDKIMDDLEATFVSLFRKLGLEKTSSVVGRHLGGSR